MACLAEDEGQSRSRREIADALLAHTEQNTFTSPESLAPLAEISLQSTSVNSIIRDAAQNHLRKESQQAPKKRRRVALFADAITKKPKPKPKPKKQQAGQTLQRQNHPQHLTQGCF